MIEVTAEDILYFKQLDERQRRLYLGLQAQKLGWHGVSRLSAAYGVNVKTIRKGKSELLQLSDLSDHSAKRIRKVGGGPKKKF